MITRTFKQIAQMIGAGWNPDYQANPLIRGVSIDTRTLEPGNLFVPIVGDRMDGHRFVQQALDKGAAAVLWEKSKPVPPAYGPVLLVDDSLLALQRLAKVYRSELPVRVIGITGSNGKTSTKDILAALLSTTFKTQKTFGNLNNHLGVPLTLLALEEDTEMAVVEMGMSALGEIQLLSSIAKPDAAIITNASEVHLADLKSREYIVQAKLEIVCGLKEDGVLVYNGDNPRLTQPLSRLKGSYERLSFGDHPANDVYPVHYTMDDTGVEFTISDRECPRLRIPLLGKHQMINALAALSVARYFGISFARITKGLLQIEATGMRNEKIEIADGITVINDAYKSNPSSLQAALDTLYEMEESRQKIAVLGDMVELGEESEKLHKSIGERLTAERLDHLFTLGRMAEHIAAAAKEANYPVERITVCADKEQLINELYQARREGRLEQSIILVKGSRALQLEDVIEALQQQTEAGRKREGA
ncbi:UDP-N-acetylmuramoyl-tripeptide--D-alanyl-D-alanine ligase [Paenibacillus senegalensis]|uniref:UDP-N-acetylmuramoyl-tripeptide--D-alanyl-D- alanine ligase n=1 Tax=Paenibacillus senegalensis TaxID=1465766 RepID=UPI0002880857|nr:UDP-N-acetylmuramoyl-tripeptide--D-alanyl-D-alanine ligase [Paenibacillus senegalensis]